MYFSHLFPRVYAFVALHIICLDIYAFIYYFFYTVVCLEIEINTKQS